MQVILPRPVDVVDLDHDLDDRHDYDVELAYALASTDPDLWAPTLPGETEQERQARLDAAVDILAELLAEADAAEEVAA